MQKAFLPGINGCIEHNATLEEIIMDAKHRKLTCHMTFFDLEDAFGSVPHSLIHETLSRNFLPHNILQYFKSCYGNSQSVVQTPQWRSNPFPFKRGVFQGDPISPIIFLMTFNPVLLQLQLQADTIGYNLDSVKFVTLPYADDFCLITTRQSTHQKHINSIHNKITSMGMRLKPSKCRGLSVCKGQAKDVGFYIGDYRGPSIKDKEQKFLGKLLFFANKSTETFKLLESTLKEGMERIQQCSVRNEYKLWMFKEYFLPSKRFLLTVHTLTATQLSKLDTLADKFVKIWAGLPRSATNAVIHLRGGLDLRSISEVHCTSHARTRLQGDEGVNHELDTTLAREGDYTRKMCITSEAELTYREVLDLNTVQGEIPQFTGERANHLQQKFNHQVQTAVRNRVRGESQEKWEEHVRSLTVQGKTLALASAEKEDALWKGYIFNLKAGTMKFLINATIDTLPTAANLKRWKKSPSDLC